jgi:exopolysaccharide biosynthesis WecB/TagA/CpsF family protein
MSMLADAAAAFSFDSFEESARGMPVATVGGLPITAVDRKAAAEILLSAALMHRRGTRPFYYTSANGEVIARVHADAEVAALFAGADQILADGQPLVMASRWLCRHPLPERVATTDLVHDVAELAQDVGATFYLLGATESENVGATAALRALYPRLEIVGNYHGYLTNGELEAKIAEIDTLAPHVLWLGMGVPREQIFVRDYGHMLTNVGLIKTSGGLFDHLSGKVQRAPGWMQTLGFEWFWRALIEPRRLLRRYISTNPRALYAILRYSQ